MPHWNEGDFKGVIAACNIAERRCIEMAERFGDDIFYSALDELQTELRAMQKLIMETVPEGSNLRITFVMMRWDPGL